jgi:hypothetical protein
MPGYGAYCLAALLSRGLPASAAYGLAAWLGRYRGRHRSAERAGGPRQSGAYLCLARPTPDARRRRCAGSPDLRAVRALPGGLLSSYPAGCGGGGPAGVHRSSGLPARSPRCGARGHRGDRPSRQLGAGRGGVARSGLPGQRGGAAAAHAAPGAIAGGPAAAARGCGCCLWAIPPSAWCDASSAANWWPCWPTAISPAITRNSISLVIRSGCRQARPGCPCAPGRPSFPLSCCATIMLRFICIYTRPLWPEQQGGVTSIMCKLRDILQSEISAQPEQWFVFHDFWAREPPLS